MNIAELCEYVGPGNIFVQNLDANTVKAEVKNGQGEITFVTKASHVTQHLNKDAEMMGLVLWLPIDRLPENLRG